MSEIVKLADPSAGPLQAIADGGLDVTMRVTTKDLEWGWDRLGKIMDAEPSSRRQAWAEDGHTEDELRLLCGLFVAVSHAIPMARSNFIEWLRALDGGDSLDDYVIWRVRQMEDEVLRDLFRYALEGRDLDALGLERLDDSVSSRGPGKRLKAA